MRSKSILTRGVIRKEYPKNCKSGYPVSSGEGGGRRGSEVSQKASFVQCSAVVGR